MPDPDRELFEKIYKEGAVWTEETPPPELRDLVEGARQIPSGTALDVGCGEGFYTIYLAERGFTVTGIDISPTAVAAARRNARTRGVTTEFVAMNVFDLDKMDGQFDFVLEWAIMHHLPPARRPKYVRNIHRLLGKGGKYLSVCFNDQNPDFGAPGQKRRVVPAGAKMPAGTEMHYSSLAEMEDLFAPLFHIIDARLIEMTAGGKSHLGNCFLLEQK